MQGYLSQVRYLQSKFESFNLLHIPKSGNAHVDFLAMLATSSAQNLPRVFLVEDLYKPTEARRETIHVHQIRVRLSWIDSIIKFLKKDFLLEERLEADKVRRRLQGSSCLKTKNYTNIPFQVLICCVFILR